MQPVAPVKDEQTVTATWEPVRRRISGVVVKRLPPLEDERGEICEMYRPAWGIHPAPLVYVYQVMIRPGKIKGWQVHRKQDDRIFVSRGALRFALFDDRADAPTHRQLDVFTVTERNRALVVIPAGVYHAIQNVGVDDAFFVNMPTEPYNHENPDKYRLPIKNDLIPFAFEDEAGW
jgi:dTDP-4-dehydrorhamnose 3,5-epimerase